MNRVWFYYEPKVGFDREDVEIDNTTTRLLVFLVVAFLTFQGLYTPFVYSHLQRFQNAQPLQHFLAKGVPEVKECLHFRNIGF